MPSVAWMIRSCRKVRRTRGVLAAGQLQGHDRDGEDQRGEGDHRRDDRGQQRPRAGGAAGHDPPKGRSNCSSSADRPIAATTAPTEKRAGTSQKLSRISASARRRYGPAHGAQFIVVTWSSWRMPECQARCPPMSTSGLVRQGVKWG
ncbi:hypothetical protein NKG94_51020 [Micromonospora sp. M12]